MSRRSRSSQIELFPQRPRRRRKRRSLATESHVPHRRRPDLDRRHPVHVTVRLAGALPSLRTTAALSRLRPILRRERHRLGFRLVHYSIQATHLHLVVEVEGRQALSRAMQRLGIRMALCVNRHLASRKRGKVFAERYHARPMKTPTEVRNGLAYVLLNGQHHRGSAPVVPRGCDPFTSGRFFDGWADFRFQRPPAPPGEADEVVSPSTWLLRVGWRRAPKELIALGEIPGMRPRRQ